MIIINAGQTIFEIYWKKFIEKNSHVSWRYSWLWHEYQKSYSGKRFEKDLSFIMVENNIPLSLAPLFLEKVNDCLQFSFAASYQNAPILVPMLGDKYRSKVEKENYLYIDKLAQDYKAGKAMLINDLFSDKWEYNHLQNYGFLDTTIATTIIDLTIDLPELWQKLRNRYKQYIHKALKYYESFIMDKSNVDYQLHEIYRKLHRKASGRVTRTRETFDLQFEMLRAGKAVLIGLKSNEKIIAASYFLNDRQNAYYASAADDPEFTTNIPLQHAIMWKTIEYYKKKGLMFFETGYQQFCGQIMDHPTKKDIDISFFKRGFGGREISLYRGIKYYKIDLMKKEIEESTKALYAHNYL